MQVLMPFESKKAGSGLQRSGATILADGGCCFARLHFRLLSDSGWLARKANFQWTVWVCFALFSYYRVQCMHFFSQISDISAMWKSGCSVLFLCTEACTLLALQVNATG